MRGKEEDKHLSVNAFDEPEEPDLINTSDDGDSDDPQEEGKEFSESTDYSSFAFMSEMGLYDESEFA